MVKTCFFVWMILTFWVDDCFWRIVVFCILVDEFDVEAISLVF
ncbi:hypothetical protein MtrunA17_Chr8g0349181 [Medicago truncatula]|uniref:Uncharacterized protein n=1 Tax=Medicago truncatula TaxID=3880 RepID=A0A396GF38_MEDTR|nr:hypothetical protein MtrunA17_Chr8g0349181 [Medicago truncatula]